MPRGSWDTTSQTRRADLEIVGASSWTLHMFRMNFSRDEILSSFTDCPFCMFYSKWVIVDDLITAAQCPSFPAELPQAFPGKSMLIPKGIKCLIFD